MSVVCPRCGSHKVHQLDYGAKIASGVDVSQNCLYKCNACKQEFGTVCGTSLYTSIVRRLTIEINGLYSGTDSVCLVYTKGADSIQYKLTSKKRNLIAKGVISDSDWAGITDKLFNSLYLTGWKSNFYNSDIIDGTTWSIEVNLEKKHALSYHGCNGYPPYWNQLLELIAPVLSEHGIDSRMFAV